MKSVDVRRNIGGRNWRTSLSSVTKAADMTAMTALVHQHESGTLASNAAHGVPCNMCLGRPDIYVLYVPWQHHLARPAASEPTSRRHAPFTTTMRSMGGREGFGDAGFAHRGRRQRGGSTITTTRKRLSKIFGLDNKITDVAVVMELDAPPASRARARSIPANSAAACLLRFPG